MKDYKNIYARQILDVLKPLVGELMAVSILKTQASKLGVDEEYINIVNVPQLSEGIRKGLVVFIGSDAALHVSTRLLKIK